MEDSVGYRWLCLTCKDRNITKVYEGETGRSARIRGAEHVRDLEGKKEKSVVFKHKMNDHQSSGKVRVLGQWNPHMYVGVPAPPPRRPLEVSLRGGGDNCGILKQ